MTDSLTDSQKIDALYEKLVVGAPVNPLPVTTTPWYAPPTDFQTKMFSTRINWAVADLTGARQANGYQKATPLIKPCDGSDADAELYAIFGFMPTGERKLWDPAQRAAAQKTAVALVAAPTAKAADNIISGAGAPGVTMDLAIYLVLSGMTTGGSFIAPALVNGGWLTVSDAVAALMKPAGSGAGPGIGN